MARAERRLGNAALDVAFWLPSLALEGDPQPLETARAVPEAIRFAASIAGFFAANAGLDRARGRAARPRLPARPARGRVSVARAVLDLPPPR